MNDHRESVALDPKTMHTAITDMPAKKPAPEPKSVGRPKSKLEGRQYLRYHKSADPDEDQYQQWCRAAAACGMTVGDWIRDTLDAEKKKPTHVDRLSRPR